MKRAESPEKTVAETSLRFLYAMRVHCRDEHMTASILFDMVANAQSEMQREVQSAVTDLRNVLMQDGTSVDEFLQKHMDDENGCRSAPIFAEHFARQALGRIAGPVMKDAMPATAKNERMRQLLRQHRCPALAKICLVAPGETSRHP
jgi:hypothetical protein